MPYVCWRLNTLAGGQVGVRYGRTEVWRGVLNNATVGSSFAEPSNRNHFRCA